MAGGGEKAGAFLSGAEGYGRVSGWCCGAVVVTAGVAIAAAVTAATGTTTRSPAGSAPDDDLPGGGAVAGRAGAVMVVKVGTSAGSIAVSGRSVDAVSGGGIAGATGAENRLGAGVASSGGLSQGAAVTGLGVRSGGGTRSAMLAGAGAWISGPVPRGGRGTNSFNESAATNTPASRPSSASRNRDSRPIRSPPEPVVAPACPGAVVIPRENRADSAETESLSPDRRGQKRLWLVHPVCSDSRGGPEPGRPRPGVGGHFISLRFKRRAGQAVPGLWAAECRFHKPVFE